MVCGTESGTVTQIKHMYVSAADRQFLVLLFFSESSL